MCHQHKGYRWRRKTERVVNVVRVDGKVEISSPELTRLDLMACDAFVREAEHLPKMRCRFVESVFGIRFVFKQSVTNSNFKYLKIGPVSVR